MIDQIRRIKCSRNTTQYRVLQNVLLLLPFFKPAAFDSFEPLRAFDLVFDIGKIIATLYILFSLVGERRQNNFNTIVLLFSASMALSTLVGGGSIQQWATQWFSCAIVGIWVVITIERSKEALYKAVIIICASWLICNLISIILYYPNGMYLGGNWIQKDNYFWGQKNSLIRLIIPGVACSVLLDLTCKKKYSIRTFVIACVGLIQISLVTSVTSIVVCLIFYCFLILLNHRAIGGYLVYALCAASSILVDVLVVGLRIQEWQPISNLISVIFNKDATLTGRALIWDSAINRVINSPLFGIGVRNESHPISADITAVHAHNDILNVMLMGGLISLALYLTCLVLVAIRLKRASCMGSAVIAGAIGAFFIVGIAEPVTSPSLFILLAIAFMFPEVRPCENGD